MTKIYNVLPGAVMPYRQVFGSENAAIDELLEECYVAPPGVVLQKPILIGKWGTGKTGLLLHRNALLSQALRKKDAAKDRIWYLDETGVQLQTLKHIEYECAHDPHFTKRILEELWKSEIIRTCALVLIELYEHYGSHRGSHWDTLRRTIEGSAKKSVWDLIPTALGLVVPSEKTQSARDFLNEIRAIYDDKTLRLLHQCLSDIREFNVQPVVAIEPIETPTSEVEDKTNLAQLLVTCLLNVYYKYFQPSERQLIRVEISIPWHRYARDQVGEPQKLYPYIGRFTWTKSSLRSFINRRIEWEFKRIRRGFIPKGGVDAWSTLFDDTVKNSNNTNDENSFDYVIRHTQYRVRDMLRLARECVEHEASSREDSVDDVLSGKNGRKVSAKNIRAAVAGTCKSTADERIQEANRRFPGLVDDVELLRGIAVPFTPNDVKKRLDKRSSPGRQRELLRVLDDLWNGGIIGAQLIASTDAAIRHLKAAFDSGTLARIWPDMKNCVFYIFEHASEKNIVDIINTFDGENGRNEHKDISVNLVLHPMHFGYLDARVNEKHPIGI